ncbi:MAG TPA: oligosaccharyl transferase, archaeosortase A system-associated [Methanoculleus sp.]|nr:oligosaccharyl transferase, archaeosortase A system-associated [Methanoculleus sp.]
MRAINDPKVRYIFIAALILIFSCIALWARLLPQDTIVMENWVNLLGNDPWYTLRQLEASLAHFPAYPWFDPMTEYPTGNTIHWGPLFTTIIGAICLLSGAVARADVMYIASLVPPLMGMAMVPLMYFIGKKVADWKTGLLASAFIAVVSGQYFYRSLFGFVDHHIAETLFSTLFALAYIVAITFTRHNPPDFKNTATLTKPAVLSVLAGIAYLLGLFVMPTMILFALIVAVFTVVQFVVDFYRSRSSTDLLFINAIVFAVAIIGLLAFGLKHGGLSLSRYSMGHVYAYLAVIAGTGALYAVSHVLKDKPKHYYPLALAGGAIAGSLVLYLASGALFDVLIGNFYSFFGEKATTLTIQEARPWDFESAWTTFHYGLLLMAGGAGVLVYRNWREEHPHQVFVLIWSAIILFSTMRHVRYEYYLAANVALLAAIFVGFALDAGSPALMGLLAGKKKEEPVVEKKGKKGKTKRKQEEQKGAIAPRSSSAPAVLLIAGIVLSLLFAGSSLSADLELGSGIGGGMERDWREALEWMGENTPDTGVDYYAIYDRETFEYPEESYGVMSWWDYGHWITFVAKRIPNANPFQHGVAGPNGAAAFFVQQSEEASSAILDTLGTRYVVTDIMMDTSKFWAMATWYDEEKGSSGYEFRVANQQGQTISLYTNEYFQTMIARLHNFDGSMVEGGAGFPEALGEYRGVGVSQLPVVPVEDVPALRHYRLIHESPTNVFNTDQIDLKYVKVFEYVPGAVINGEGTIEVTMVSNTGREFVYRQESIDGRFIVPYSTQDNPYDVRATGPYRIIATGEMIGVSEDAVVNGMSVT